MIRNHMLYMVMLSDEKSPSTCVCLLIVENVDVDYPYLVVGVVSHSDINYACCISNLFLPGQFATSLFGLQSLSS